MGHLWSVPTKLTRPKESVHGEVSRNARTAARLQHDGRVRREVLAALQVSGDHVEVRPDGGAFDDLFGAGQRFQNPFAIGYNAFCPPRFTLHLRKAAAFKHQTSDKL